MNRALEFYLGAATPTGFADFFRLLRNEDGLRVYLIKSGPGCGKSSMLRRVAERAASAGHDLELIRCSSDPDSLDGIICRALGFAAVDATAPHALEPSIIGPMERVVSLYDTIDNDALVSRYGELRELFALNSALHARARRFISAAGSLCADVVRISGGCLLEDKARRYALSLASRTLGPDAGAGRESLRFVSAVTPLGVHGFAKLNAESCERVYVFEDRFGALAAALLATLRDAALASGCDVLSCRDFLAPYERLCALFIPSESLCFLSSAALAGESAPPHAVRVRDARFYRSDDLAAAEKRLNFSKKAAASLLAEAGALALEAKEVHDEIEKIYSPCVNFDAVRALEARLCAEVGL